MKPGKTHKKSWRIRRFKPNRRPAGLFSSGVVFLDAALLLLVFFLVVSPFVLQPGINMMLPSSPFTGGARFGSMVLAITRHGWFYFNDERCSAEKLEAVLRAAAKDNPEAPLIIEADKRVPYGTVIEAWNAALAAGIKEVSLASQIAAVSEDLP